jgi:hypothetical protein
MLQAGRSRVRFSMKVSNFFSSLFNNASTTSVVWWSEFMATDPEVRVRFPALPYFVRSSWSGTESTQPREYN